MASFCHLPEDVVQDIFLRVPADSLVRFKCVSKSWYALICSLIKDPRFVAKNLQNFGNKSSSSLVLRRRCSCNGQQQNNCCGRRFSLLTPFVDDGDNNRVGSLIEDLCFPLCGQYRWSDWWAGIHGDGIICLLKRDQGLASEVLLCNPALQEFKLVPGSKTENDFRSGGMGFGYDSRTNTYKLVRILRDYCSEVTAEVHVLGTNSWRRLNVSQRVLILDQWNYLYWKGVCYWQAENYMAESLEWEIRCFNMSDEIFYFIPFPHDELDFTSFSVWNDSFALFLCIGEIDDPDLAS